MSSVAEELGLIGPPSDEILASIFGHFGFQLESIERMRKRQSKSGLYEAVVFMRRG
ncbi:MAG TPA: hypothetical protein PK867_22900 [Pirellulales bacterium]|nr:hypothetical protein [Pirellulales bacterium]